MSHASRMTLRAAPVLFAVSALLWWLLPVGWVKALAVGYVLAGFAFIHALWNYHTRFDTSGVQPNTFEQVFVVPLASLVWLPLYLAQLLRGR